MTIDIIKHTCQTMNIQDGVCTHHVPDDKDPVGFCDQPKQFRCIEKLKDTLPRLSHSSTLNFMRCPQLYYLRDIMGVKIKPKHQSNALKAGTIWDMYLSGQASNIKDYIDTHNVPDDIVCKVRALVKAAKALGIKKPNKVQTEVSYIINDTLIVGYVDETFDNGIAEDKLSSNPDWYCKRQNIEHQIGTYLMADERWDFADLRVVRLPVLRTGSGKFDGESGYAFTDRIYYDIIKRPLFYFPKLNRDNGTYGVRFYRGEMDLRGIEHIYKVVIRLMKHVRDNALWYPNTACCYNPFPCDYIPVCSTGTISDILFEYRSGKERG